MVERDNLLTQVAEKISAYRPGEIPVPDKQHVDRWLSQFTPKNQLPLLRELNHLLGCSFLDKSDTEDFITSLINRKPPSNEDQKNYWKGINFLSIQLYGESQKELLKIVNKTLQEQFSLSTEECGIGSDKYLYIDDILFSGGRVQQDIREWVNNKAPSEAKIEICLIAAYTLGLHETQRAISRIIRDSGKNIKVSYNHKITIENRKSYNTNSQVFWPILPQEDPTINDYITQLKSEYPPVTRGTRKEILAPFLSEEGRQTLENEFLLAGIKICQKIENPTEILKPLGFSRYGIGFGSTIITYRNCPNNCPLALWWGDPEAETGPLNWYPLLPRKTYNKIPDF